MILSQTTKLLRNTILCILFVHITQLSTAQEYGENSEIRVNDNISGTLLIPDSPTKKLAIIIPGSGPTDRDGNQQMTRNNSLKLLAEGLSEQGIASYRFDKRVLTLLRRNALEEKDLRFDMFIEDAVAVVEFFKEQGRFSDIYIIGHSQGSLVGMVAAQQTDIDGFISLSGSGQAVDQTIITQVGLQMPDLEEKTIAAFKTLREEGEVTDYSPALASIFRPSVQPFMYSWLKYDPKAEIGKLDSDKVLIISGSNDVQISLEEAQLLHDGNPNAQMVIIDQMNHVLRLIEGDNLENIKSYNLPKLPLATEVVATIATFINR